MRFGSSIVDDTPLLLLRLLRRRWETCALAACSPRCPPSAPWSAAQPCSWRDSPLKYPYTQLSFSSFIHHFLTVKTCCHSWWGAHGAEIHTGRFTGSFSAVLRVSIKLNWCVFISALNSGVPDPLRRFLDELERELNH